MKLEITLNTPDGLRAIRALRRFVDYDSQLLQQGDAEQLRYLCEQLEEARERYLTPHPAPAQIAPRSTDTEEQRYERAIRYASLHGWPQDKRKATRGERPAWYVEYCRTHFNV